MPKGRGNRGQQNVEAQRIIRSDEKDHDIGLPRLVARIWGLVSGICKFLTNCIHFCDLFFLHFSWILGYLANNYLLIQ